MLRGMKRTAGQLRLATRDYAERVSMIGAVVMGGGPVRARLRDGTRVHAPEVRTLLAAVDEVYSRRMYSPDGFEPGGDDVVVDVGAHIGLYTMYAAQRTVGRVIAVEPSDDNVRYLCENIAANELKNVVVVHAALGAREGSGDLLRGRFSVGHSLIANPAAETGFGGIEEVRVTTLGALFDAEGVNEVDLLKIDCEGAEGTILRAAGVEVLRRVRRIVLEYHDGWSELNHDALMRLLQSARFSVRRVADRDCYGYLYAMRDTR